MGVSFSVLKSLLRSEKGEVGGGDGSTDSGATATPPETTAQPAAADSAQTEESFIDPASLPEELKPHWKRMHGSFTKRMQEFRQSRDKLEAYDKFYTDPAYAKQVVMAVAPQIGLTVAEPGRSASKPSAAGNGNQSSAPAELVERIREKLSPELQWMAQSQADAVWEAQQMALRPYLERQNQDQARQRESEYEALAAELSGRVPDWEDHEEEMSQLFAFLRSPNMRDAHWGSKLEMLYNIVTGNALATQEAVRRMGDAARNRTVTSRVASGSTENVSERIMKARSSQEAFEIAAKAAVDQIEGGRS